MDSRDSEEGPLFVWSFPLIRTVQNRRGILRMGIESVISSNEDKQDTSAEYSNDSSAIETDDSILDDVEDSITELDENSEAIFESSDSGTTVYITDTGFDPSETSIEIGETVTWVNQTDTTTRVSAVENADFTSPILSQGEEYEETFYTQDTVTYKDPTSGDSERGTIEVGESAEDPDTDPVPFDGDGMSVRSMGEAADEKDDDDRGF